MFKQIESLEEFHSLLDYYISCIEKEEISSNTFNLRSEGEKFYSNIFKEEQFFLHKKEQIKIKDTKELKKLFNKYKLLQKNTLFYGYPIFQDSTGKISPIFFVEIFFDKEEDSFRFTRESVNPEFNHYILGGHYGVEEINKIRSELEGEENLTIKIKKVEEFLHLGPKKIVSTLDQNPLRFNTSPQIKNKAIIYFGEKGGFTKGLLEELQKLKGLPLPKLKSTSLNLLMGGDLSGPQKNKKDFLEIFQLNESQEKSVKSVFSNNLSVITGPPGTGKSQVVLNIIANAVLNDKTVLFSSKNNQAVDVVNEKLKSMLSHDLVIRMGTREHRKKAKLQIHKLFQKKDSLIISPNFEKDNQDLKRINSEIRDVKEQIRIMSQFNEEIERVQSQKDISAKEIPKKLYSLCERDNFKTISKFKLEGEIKRTFGSIGFFIRILRWIFPSIFMKRESNLFNEYYNKLSSHFRNYLDKNINLESREIKRFLIWILIFKKIGLFNKEINSIKETLLKSDSIYSLQSKLNRFQERKIKLSRKIFESYWLKKIKDASLSDENHVSRYLDALGKLETFIENPSLWRQLVNEQESEFHETLSFLPIWVVTNLSVRRSLPLKENLFDLLIIDEASQNDIASALPLFYRAKQVVIIGDPKQLKHISLLREKEDQKIASEEKVTRLFLDYAYSKNSLYDLAERLTKVRNKPPLFLDKHYRSHRDIISFPNEYFYGNRLNIMTDEDKLVFTKIHPRGIKWIDIHGKPSQINRLSNEEEAIKIVEELKKYKGPNHKNISFGVVTLFRAQMELISSMITKSKELNDLDITVGTVHKFQGDEKDIILFSPVISSGVKQSTLNWIHTTTQLLNVAVTRARSTLIIMGDKKRCFDAGGVLKNLVEHTNSKKDITIDFDSPIEEKLYERLSKDKIRIIPQHSIKIRGTKPYRLDFALFINDNKYDIEIDGGKAHSQRVEQDSLRDTHLRMEGWKVRRFRANEVQNNLNGVVEEIKRFC